MKMKNGFSLKGSYTFRSHLRHNTIGIVLFKLDQKHDPIRRITLNRLGNSIKWGKGEATHLRFQSFTYAFKITTFLKITF